MADEHAATAISDAVLAALAWRVDAPADHLRRFLAEVRPAGVLISGSVPIYLAGAHRSIQAAQIPALVGGRAFGPDDLRARRLGADGWTPTAIAAAQLLTGWPGTPHQSTTGPLLSFIRL